MDSLAEGSKMTFTKKNWRPDFFFGGLANLRSGQNNKNGRKNTSPCGEFEQFIACQKGVTRKQRFSAAFPEHLSACAECQNLLKTEYDKCCTGKNEEYVQPRQRERTTRNPHYVFHKYYKKYLNSGSKQNKN